MWFLIIWALCWLVGGTPTVEPWNGWFVTLIIVLILAVTD